MPNDLKSEIMSRLDIGYIRSYYSKALGGEIGKMNTSGWAMASCPYHEDETPSFSINLMQEGACKCFSCNYTSDLLGFHQRISGHSFPDTLKYFAKNLGIDPDANPEYSKATSKKEKKKLGTLVAVYQYIDIHGNIVSETVKYENPKDYRQRRPHPDQPGKYIWNLKDIEVIPYNLQSVTASDTVYFVEGEKDADALGKIGLTATCNPMGAGKWWDSLTPYFRDKAVIILPDNDEAGKAHAQLVAAKIKKVTKSIRIIDLPGLLPKGDVSDWLAAGNTKADLLEIVNKDGGRYENHIDFLNKRHAAIMLGGKFAILNEYYDLHSKRFEVDFSSVKDFYHRYANRQIPNPDAGGRGQAKTIPAVTDWLKSPDRREYKQIVFDPKSTPEGCYNYWRGFSTQPKRGDWSLMQAHILENICSGNQGHYDYLIAWLARIIQDPGGERPGTAVVIRGGQGVGKGQFMNEFRHILGSHFLQITNHHHLTGRFNNHLKNIILLFVDEGFWAGDKSSEGLIRGIITETELIIEPKNLNAISLKSHINIVIASNSDWVVPAGIDERRFFCIDVSDAHQQDLPYFGKIKKQMRSGGREAMMYDLFNHDRSKINLRKIPRTGALFTQILDTMQPHHQFWFETLRRGTLHPDDSEWICKIQKRVLHDLYVEWCERYKIRFIDIPSQFGKKMQNVFPDKTDSTKKETTYDNLKGKNKGIPIYIFPELFECQLKFQQVLKIGIDFDDDETFEV